MRMRPTFREIYTQLLSRVDAGRWWSAATRFEMMIGAVLVQHTAWRNVESSLELLDARGLLDARAICDAEQEEIIAAIRPSGFMRAKSRTCREVAEWTLRRQEAPMPNMTGAQSRRTDPEVTESSEGAAKGFDSEGIHLRGFDSKRLDPERALAEAVAVLSDEQLRDELLALVGVGPETADVIALYAFRRPAFIWDSYARRMLAALGYEVPDGYERARAELGQFVAGEGFSVEEFATFHGLIVEAGKQARAAGGWDNFL
ncbi:hypothetical protein EKN07_11115 [Actinobaculum sp. 352]|nr:hypothetical protein EKN07_11115 [Actinobaculum sp. 352]